MTQGVVQGSSALPGGPSEGSNAALGGRLARQLPCDRRRRHVRTRLYLPRKRSSIGDYLLQWMVIVAVDAIRDGDAWLRG